MVRLERRLEAGEFDEDTHLRLRGADQYQVTCGTASGTRAWCSGPAEGRGHASAGGVLTSWEETVTGTGSAGELRTLVVDGEGHSADVSRISVPDSLSPPVILAAGILAAGQPAICISPAHAGVLFGGAGQEGQHGAAPARANEAL